MALAQLCAMLRQYPHSDSEIHHIRALIVDHRAREGSDLEAKLVTERLARMGMNASHVGEPQLLTVKRVEIDDP